MLSADKHSQGEIFIHTQKVIRIVLFTLIALMLAVVAGIAIATMLANRRRKTAISFKNDSDEIELKRKKLAQMSIAEINKISEIAKRELARESEEDEESSRQHMMARSPESGSSESGSERAEGE